MPSGGTPGRQHSFFMCVLFSTCVHHLLECVGFIWHICFVLPMLPISQHGECKGFFTMNTPRPGGRCHMYVSWMYVWLRSFLSIHMPRAILLSLNVRVHHLAARPESLCVIAWLLHCCCSLAACPENMAAARTFLIVAMSTQA